MPKVDKLSIVDILESTIVNTNLNTISKPGKLRCE